MSEEEQNSKATILIADDFDGWRLQVRKMLQKHPEWKVVGEACDGRAAIEKARQLQPHIAILDVSMPGLNGDRGRETDSSAVSTNPDHLPDAADR